ncbi:hypothetical protein JDS96_29090 [Bacillus cereus group sp. N21]|nr:hypothetical protein [Bacillus cereus group sp. N21]
MKKVAKVIPAAFVLSSALFVAPGFSSAATDTPTNVGNLPVVISSQEAKAPMTAEQAEKDKLPIPKAPVGPYQEFPYEAYSTTQYGDVIDYIFLDVYPEKAMTVSTSKMFNSPDMITVLPDGTRTAEIKDHYNVDLTPGKLAYSVGIAKNSELGKQFLSDTKLKKDIYWKLIDSNIVDKNSGYHWSKSVTSGLSKSNTVGFALTVGVEAGLGDALSFSTSLTTSFEHNTTITTEDSVVKTFDFNPRPDSVHAQYRTALYQQLAKYSVQPGSQLQGLIDTWNKAEDFPFQVKLKKEFTYPVDVILALTSKEKEEQE